MFGKPNTVTFLGRCSILAMKLPPWAAAVVTIAGMEDPTLHSCTGLGSKLKMTSSSS